jgi:hypothetical protein
LLNAQIPRTAQYGPPGCSCWASGCGELEVLGKVVPGAEDRESTLRAHASVKMAVLFQGETGVIRWFTVPEGTVFEEGLEVDIVGRKDREK